MVQTRGAKKTASCSSEEEKPHHPPPLPTTSPRTPTSSVSARSHLPPRTPASITSSSRTAKTRSSSARKNPPVASPPVATTSRSTKASSSPALSVAGDSADDLEFSDNDSASSSVPYSTSASLDTSNQTKKRKPTRLPFAVEKQLLIDIERKGGIKFFDAGKKQGHRVLFDERPELFGDIGHPIRDKARKRLNYLKKLPTADYFQVLARLGVKPHLKHIPRETKEEDTPQPDPVASSSAANPPSSILIPTQEPVKSVVVKKEKSLTISPAVAEAKTSVSRIHTTMSSVSPQHKVKQHFTQMIDGTGELLCWCSDYLLMSPCF